MTTDGRRFLDFGAGIATSLLGHGHPHLAAAIAEAGRTRDARLQPLSRARKPSGSRQRLVEATLRRQRVLLQLGRRGERGHDQDDAPKAHVGHRQARALPHHLLRGRVPRPHAGDARRHRQPSTTSRASARRWKVSTTCRSTTSTRCATRSGRRPPASSSSRSRARAACARPTRSSCATCARLATSSACILGHRRSPVRHGPHRQAVRA